MGLFAYASLCLFGLLLSSPFPGVEAQSCPNNWVENQGNCYAYFDTKMTWIEAEIACQNSILGAHLASVHSFSESAFLVRHIIANQREQSDVWIGLFDSLQWSDDSVYDYKDWVDREPDRFCVALIQSTNFAEWNFRDCRSSQAYICKYELWRKTADMSSNPDLQI